MSFGKRALGLNDKEWEVIYKLNKLLKDKVGEKITTPALFKKIELVKSQVTSYKIIAELKRKNYVNEDKNGGLTLNVVQILYRANEYFIYDKEQRRIEEELEEKELEKKTLKKEIGQLEKEIGQLEKESDQLKKDKTWISTTKDVSGSEVIKKELGGFYGDTKKIRTKPISVEAIMQDIKKTDKESSFLMLFHQDIDTTFENLKEGHGDTFMHEITGRKNLDIIMIIPFPSNGDSNKLKDLNNLLKKLLQQKYNKEFVRVIDESSVFYDSRVIEFIFITKPFTVLENHLNKIDVIMDWDVEGSFYSFGQAGSLENDDTFQGLIIDVQELAKTQLVRFLKVWEKGKKIEEVIGE